VFRTVLCQGGSPTRVGVDYCHSVCAGIPSSIRSGWMSQDDPYGSARLGSVLGTLLIRVGEGVQVCLVTGSSGVFTLTTAPSFRSVSTVTVDCFCKRQTGRYVYPLARLGVFISLSLINIAELLS